MVLLKRTFLMSAFILCSAEIYALDATYLEQALGFYEVPVKYCTCVSPVKYTTLCCCLPAYVCHAEACEKNWERMRTRALLNQEKDALKKQD